MSAKHTPGPWTLEPKVARGIWIEAPKGHNDCYVALATMCSNEAEEDANARLIAAAPDLLAALIDARSQLENYELDRTGEAFNDTRINTAIAKALGEEGGRP